jgi:hypothetical protein
MSQQDTSTEGIPRELDSRTSDGIHVRLLWRPLDNHVSVAVTDTKSGETFEVDVRPGLRALDVFHHPYVYALRTLTVDSDSVLSGREADA